MTTAQELIRECGRRGVSLNRRGDALEVRRPNRLTPQMIDQLRRQKADVLALMATGASSLPDDEVVWLPTARKVVAGEFEGGHRSLLESLLIGVRGIKHPLCVEARFRLEAMLGGGK